MITPEQQAQEIVASMICPECGGTGVIVDYVAACCRNPDEDGNCCNCPIAEPIQEQCCRCEATGYLKTEQPLPTIINHSKK